MKKNSTRRRLPRRRRATRPKRKTTQRGAVKVSQLMTINSRKPKPQVFMKTALSQLSGNTIVGAGASVVQLGGALASSMPDWSSIINLYNRYKMIRVKYTFTCQPSSPSGTLFSYDLPKMMVRYNYDSNLTTAGIAIKMQEIPNVKQFQFTPDKTTFSYTYYPRCIEPVYLSSISTGYKLAKQQYIDVQYGSVPHYGIMWYIDTLATGISISYDISWEVAFKYQD